MKSKWQLFFSLRKLPDEFADVERLTDILGTVVIFLSVLFIPGRHYLAYLVFATAILIGGRAVGFLMHDRLSATSQERIVAPIRIVGPYVFAGLGIIALTGALYFVWRDLDPLFMMLAILCTAAFCYFFGNRRGKIRIAMGILDIALIVISLVLYFSYFLVGFLASGAFAGFFAWALLLKKGNAGPETSFGSAPAKPTQR